MYPTRPAKTRENLPKPVQTRHAKTRSAILFEFFNISFESITKKYYFQNLKTTAALMTQRTSVPADPSDFKTLTTPQIGFNNGYFPQLAAVVQPLLLGALQSLTAVLLKTAANCL
jgi:hypothetical protein